MVYLNTWDEFQTVALQLYANDPLRARFHMKYKPVEGVIVVRITDNRVCLKYRTDQLADVKRVEQLTTKFLTDMTNKHVSDGGDVSMIPVSGTEPSGVPASAPLTGSPKKKKKGGRS